MDNKKIENKTTKFIVDYKWDFILFDNPRDWKKAIKKEWHEEIHGNGRLCYGWDYVYEHEK